jgi:protein-S-isoprenylcysteine O-methyltransferase Ste14
MEVKRARQSTRQPGRLPPGSGVSPGGVVESRLAGRHQEGMMTPETPILAVWGVWVLSWVIAAAWSGTTARRARLRGELPYRVLIIAGAVLAFGLRLTGRAPDDRSYPLTPAGGWVLAVFVALGCVFAWWARLHLGMMWSSGVTRKAGHRIVDTGPYRSVRHPIYTGVIFALLSTAAAQGTPASFAGVALMIAGIVMKARLEEKFLREEFDREAYDAYARRVPMLVPFWPP